MVDRTTKAVIIKDCKALQLWLMFYFFSIKKYASTTKK